MDREELKAAIDELMRQYADEEIDGATYAEKMMELTSSAQLKRSWTSREVQAPPLSAAGISARPPITGRSAMSRPSRTVGQVVP